MDFFIVPQRQNIIRTNYSQQRTKRLVDSIRVKYTISYTTEMEHFQFGYDTFNSRRNVE